MKIIFINKTKRFEMRFRYNFVISNDFIMKINLKALLVIKRMINLNVNVNKKITISSLSVSNDCSIANFKSNALKTIFNEILLKIKMKLNKSLIFSSKISYESLMVFVSRFDNKLTTRQQKKRVNNSNFKQQVINNFSITNC